MNELIPQLSDTIALAISALKDSGVHNPKVYDSIEKLEEIADELVKIQGEPEADPGQTKSDE